MNFGGCLCGPEIFENQGKKSFKSVILESFVVSLILGIAIGDRGGGSGRGFNNLMESLSPEEASYFH